MGWVFVWAEWAELGRELGLVQFMGRARQRRKPHVATEAHGPHRGRGPERLLELGVEAIVPHDENHVPS